MNKAMRISCVGYIIAMLSTMYFIFFPHPLPYEAMQYQYWYFEQTHANRTLVVIVSAWLGIAATVISLLSAAALFFNQRWARLPFLVSAVIIVLSGLIPIFTNSPPMLFTKLEATIEEFSNIFAGVIIAISFINLEKAIP